MFDYDEIEESVQAKGADAWKEATGPREKDELDAVREAACRAQNVEKQVESSPLPETLGNEILEEVHEDWVMEHEGRRIELRVAIASATRERGEKMMFCALFVPGMPQPEFGNARMADPLPSAVMKRCWAIGLPTVRFDYEGCGESKGTMPDVLGGDVKMEANCAVVLLRLLQEYCEMVAVIAFSAGNNMIIPLLAEAHARGKVAAYVNLNHGTRASALKLTPDEALEALKEKIPDALPEPLLKHFDSLDVPSLFIVGDKDWLTPMADIELIVHRKTRADAAAPRWQLRTLPGKHDFTGAVDAPAQAVAEFLLKALSERADAA